MPWGMATTDPGVTSSQSAGAAATASAAAERRARPGAARDDAGEARPQTRLGAAEPPGPAGRDAGHAAPAEQRQQRRLERERGRHGHEGDDEPCKAERADERHRDEEKNREADGDPDPGDEHRPPRGLHRRDDGVAHLPSESTSSYLNLCTMRSE